MYEEPIKKSETRPPSAGNALFLILIAVALFAALSYAITQSGKGSGNITSETAELDAAKMIQTAGFYEQAVQRLRLSGCALDELSFDTTPGTGSEMNGSSPSDLSCHIHAANGGGVPVPEGGYVSNGDVGWGGGTHTRVMGVGTDSGGTLCGACDFILFYYNVPDNVCTALNRKLINTSTAPNCARSLNDGFQLNFPANWHTCGTGMSSCVTRTVAPFGNVLIHVMEAR